MPPNGPRSKDWCFTLNNYTPADVDRLMSPPADVEYLIFGREVGLSGTRHLQGTVCFRSPKNLSQAISIIGQAHFSTTRSLLRSITYCKKEGDFTEIGSVPERSSQRGRRSELQDFKTSVKEGIKCLKELRELHSDVCAAFPKFVKDYLEDNTEVMRVELHPLRGWQETLHSELILEADNRKIKFIVDITGNQGKSWFARYFCDYHKDSQIIVPGKKADMAYTVKEDCRVFFLDCPRSKQGDYIQYDFLEELKNGYVFSPKYESRVKKLQRCHVVVLMNENPDMTKLSSDRYDIKVL